jgi:hypothetical protein
VGEGYGGTGSGGRAHVRFITSGSNYASQTADGSAPAYTPSGPIPGTGYKTRI